MKTARRHELQTNTLADWLGESIETAKPYARLVAGIILAAIVLVIFYFVMSQRTHQEQERGWLRYYNALNSESATDLDQVAKEYAGSPVGDAASLLAADRHLTEGCNKLFSDRAKAKEELRSAVAEYKVASTAKDPMVQQRAMFGLAKAYEADKELDAARKGYKLLAERFPKGVFADTAKERAADLDKTATKEFYDWFADQKPVPSTGSFDGFGDPFNKPEGSPFLNPGTGMPNDDLHKSVFPFGEKPEDGTSTDDDASSSEGTNETEGTSDDAAMPEEGSSDETPPTPEGETKSDEAPAGDKP